MLHRKLTGFLVGLSVLSLASLATAGVPDPTLSIATMNAPAGCSLYNVPSGIGDPFTLARTAVGAPADASIVLTLVDGTGAPIPFYPSEDLWLDTSGGSFAYCANGTAADLATDVDGTTEWVTPLNAGGSSLGFTTHVFVAGSALNQAGFALTFNSSDINGDLFVNLTDVTPFSQDFNFGYNYRSDFVRDGSINLSDVTKFAQANGAGCP